MTTSRDQIIEAAQAVSQAWARQHHNVAGMSMKLAWELSKLDQALAEWEVGSLAIDWIMVGDAAAELGLSGPSVRRLCGEGVIRATKASRDWLLDPLSVKHYAEHRRPPGRPTARPPGSP